MPSSSESRDDDPTLVVEAEHGGQVRIDSFPDRYMLTVQSSRATFPMPVVLNDATAANVGKALCSRSLPQPTMTKQELLDLIRRYGNECAAGVISVHEDSEIYWEMIEAELGRWEPPV